MHVKGGHMDIVKLMVSRGASCWDMVEYFGACKGGHMDISKFNDF